MSARWNPAQGFSYGFNDFEGSATDCLTPANPAAAGQDGCLMYPGDTALQGKVDQATGTIQITVPLSLLKALDKPEGGRGEYPVERAAMAGDRLFAAAVYAQANTTSPSQSVQGYLIPLDNSPAMDFIIPGKVGSKPPVGGGGGTPAAGSGGGRFGGAFGLALLPLTLVALRRRRQLH